MTSSFNKDELLGNLLAIVCSLCFFCCIRVLIIFQVEYKNLVSQNHFFIVESIKNSIELLIIELQDRENKLLSEANKWKTRQIE